MTKKDFGGQWTQTKLDVFIQYVRAYLTILNTHKGKYGWKTIYFDGFAGYGSKEKTSPEEEGLFTLFETTDEHSLYKGSASRILEMQAPYLFDWYYFIDTNPEHLAALEVIRRQIKHIPQERIVIRQADANQQIKELAKLLKKDSKYAALAFLDPFGMQVEWESIAAFKNERRKLKIDLWILIPSGVAINRLLDHKQKFRSKYKDTLERFFGLSIDEITREFYKVHEQPTLFGETQENARKISNAVEHIARLYRRQLQTVFDHVTKPYVLKNSRNNPIFHLIFASNNKTALKIAGQIIQSHG